MLSLPGTDLTPETYYVSPGGSNDPDCGPSAKKCGDLTYVSKDKDSFQKFIGCIINCKLFLL